tara:strand:+ start:12786 stop:13637 length:852 start_codon:yes stop_codon:yes gene_type:complete
MYLEKYKISETVNNDRNPCFNNEGTYPYFQEELEGFKSFLISMVNNKQSSTFYKFGDGDYRFLKQDPTGSAAPGKRALSKPYDQINHQQFTEGAQKCDYYTCEIYPENRDMFYKVINKNINYPAEYGYGLVANKWFFKTFKGKIGLIGADKKIELIKSLMVYPEYHDYLGLDSFNDYIKVPQRFACDDLEATEKFVGEQLKNSTSDIFLLGIGHVKSGLLHTLKKYKKAVYLDVGSSIDALAGIIEINRPYFGDWVNFQTRKFDYRTLDFLNYQGQGKHKILD